MEINSCNSSYNFQIQPSENLRKQTCSLSTHEDQELQGQSCLDSKFEATTNYMRPYLKVISKQKKHSKDIFLFIYLSL